MDFPDEHAARLYHANGKKRKPAEYQFYSRYKTGYPGISIIVGLNKITNKREIQALRFSKKLFKSKYESEKWIKNNPDLIKAWEKQVIKYKL